MQVRPGRIWVNRCGCTAPILPFKVFSRATIRLFVSIEIAKRRPCVNLLYLQYQRTYQGGYRLMFFKFSLILSKMHSIIILIIISCLQVDNLNIIENNIVVSKKIKESFSSFHCHIM